MIGWRANRTGQAKRPVRGKKVREGPERYRLDELPQADVLLTNVSRRIRLSGRTAAEVLSRHFDDC